MDREAITRIYQAWLHSTGPLSSKKQVSSVDDPQSPAKLNMYLDNYLHTLGYCARRKRFRQH